MMASFTALLTRTLRLDTRAVSTHVRRFCIAGLVLLLLAETSTMSTRMNAAGRALLGELAYTAAACITLFGISLFSSVITEEKEEQTIGLLRMAGLRPLAILLAKSGARVWDVLLVFAAVLPFALLAVTLGGVSTIQVIACAIALAAYLLMLAGIGVLLSVLRPTGQDAAAWLVGVLILTQVVPWLFWSAPWAQAVTAASIWVRLGALLYSATPLSLVSTQLWVSLLVAVCCYALALALFDRFVRDEESQQARPLAARRGPLARLFTSRRPAPGLWAIVSKDLQVQCGGRLMMAIKLVSLLVLIGVCLGIAAHSRNEPLDAVTIGKFVQFICLWWIPLEVAINLSRMFSTEIREQTLSTLLTLPYGAAAIAHAKLLAVAISISPALLVLGIGVALAPRGFTDAVTDAFSTPGGWSAITFVALFWYLSCFMSLVMRRGALAGAVGVMFLYYLIIVIFFARGGGATDTMVFISFITGLLCCAMHCSIANICRSKASH
jgi:ABC-type transport system involved in multi-copper enzyme maturation permease subunit